MKIVFFESAQNYGGARIATVDLAHRLATRHTSIIIDVNGSCKPFMDACKQKKIPVIVLEQKSKPIIISATNLYRKICNYLKFIPSYLNTRRSLKKQLRQISPDYVCVNGIRPLSYLYKLYPRSKIVFFAHGWYLDSQIPPIERFLFKNVVNVFVCGSEATRHALYCSRIAPLERLNVLHIGIDEHRLRTDVAKIDHADGCIKILHSAGFTKGKGQLISVEIAKKLKESGVKFKLILAGIIYAGYESHSYHKKVVDRIHEYGLENEVELIVGLSNVIHYFRACDILIHPSDSEGLGMVIMEAMILKKPVIANPVGGIIDMILHGYTGMLTRYNNVNDYVNYIKLLTENLALKQRIIDNAYSLISSTFTIEQQLNELENILNYE